MATQIGQQLAGAAQMLPGVADRSRSVIAFGLNRAPEAIACGFQVGDTKVGHLQTDKCIGRFVALLNELIDDGLSVYDELLALATSVSYVACHVWSASSPSNTPRAVRCDFASF